MSPEAMHPSAQTAESEEPNEQGSLDYLTISERCDQCGSQSYYKIVLPNDGQLFLCYHHYNSHEEKLFEVAEDIVDESELLHRR